MNKRLKTPFQKFQALASGLITVPKSEVDADVRNKKMRNLKSMNTKTDRNSALAGIAVGVLVMLLIGAGTPSSEIGRYQVSGAGTPSVFVMVDTETGRAWMANGTANQLRSDADFFAKKN